jgi:coenzyme F420-reducing hydrogenase delta subunit
MDKFKISTPADLKDPVRKKEFFDYIDKNYKAKDEMSENTYQMSNPAVKTKVEMVINTLKEIEVDGETMEYILDEVGMSDQMASQLSDKVDDEGFPYMSGGRP